MVYTIMETQSPLINSLLDYLDEPPVLGSEPNMTTLLRQGQAAQEWLLTHYLPAWLEIIGGLVDCDYPLGRAHRVQLRALARLAERLDANSLDSEQIMMLNSVESLIKGTLRIMNKTPSERDMQWGLWARDVPMSIAYAFSETTFLNPLICEGIAPCCMFAAFLVSMVVTDSGVAEEIEERMFGEKPRVLVELMRTIPDSPEA